ncbi:MAG: DUF3842 family protein [Synergistaceae bacterium]
MKDLTPVIVVIDGQGGGIGKALTERIKSAYPKVPVRALGTNSAATSAMMKGGADDGATGENAIVFNVSRAEIITGPIGIIMANGLLGEVTPKAALAVGDSSAVKILVPSQRCSLIVAGSTGQTTQYCIDSAVALIGEELKRRGIL